MEPRKNDNLASGQSQEFPLQRDEPHFNNRDIDERYQRRSLSPFRKDDRLIIIFYCSISFEHPNAKLEKDALLTGRF